MPSSAICTVREAKQQSIFRTVFLREFDIQGVTTNSKYSKYEIVHLTLWERKENSRQTHKTFSGMIYKSKPFQSLRCERGLKQHYFLTGATKKTILNFKEIEISFPQVQKPSESRWMSLLFCFLKLCQLLHGEHYSVSQSSLATDYSYILSFCDLFNQEF